MRNFADPASNRSSCSDAEPLIADGESAHPLLIAVDDVQRIDAPLGRRAGRVDRQGARGSLRRWPMHADSGGGERPARCGGAASAFALEALTRAETRSCLARCSATSRTSTAHAGDLQVALGNPRQSMDMAQHLVDEGCSVTRRALDAAAQIGADDLPRSAAAAVRARIDAVVRRRRFSARRMRWRSMSRFGSTIARWPFT